MTLTLETLFGSRAAALTLLFIQNYGEGHARRIATTFDTPLTGIRRQLQRLEAGGLLASRSVGRTRVFTWNPRNPSIKDLQIFLESELGRLDRETTLKYFRQRQRPRRSGKPS